MLHLYHALGPPGVRARWWEQGGTALPVSSRWVRGVRTSPRAPRRKGWIWGLQQNKHLHLLPASKITPGGPAVPRSDGHA